MPISPNALSPKSPVSQPVSCRATAAIPISHETTNPIDQLREGHGRQHHMTAQKIVKAANIVTTRREAKPLELVKGSSSASKTTATRAVPLPINTLRGLASDLLVKYCTCAA